jgi:chromosome segregation ATPase
MPVLLADTLRRTLLAMPRQKRKELRAVEELVHAMTKHTITLMRDVSLAKSDISMLVKEVEELKQDRDALQTELDRCRRRCEDLNETLLHLQG